MNFLFESSYPDVLFQLNQWVQCRDEQVPHDWRPVVETQQVHPILLCVDSRQVRRQCMKEEKDLWKVSESREDTSSKNIPPDADMEPLTGTAAIRLAPRTRFMFSMSSQRTPECPRINEFIRTSVADFTQASGMTEPIGSRSGSMAGVSVEEGRKPMCCIWNNEFPRVIGELVLVSVVVYYLVSGM